MKVWDRLIMKWRREERRRKTVVCINLKQTSTKCGVALCDVYGNAEKNIIAYIWKDMDEFIDVSHVFINDISRYIAAFCDLKKKTKRSFIF